MHCCRLEQGTVGHGFLIACEESDAPVENSSMTSGEDRPREQAALESGAPHQPSLSITSRAQIGQAREPPFYVVLNLGQMRARRRGPNESTQMIDCAARPGALVLLYAP